MVILSLQERYVTKKENLAMELENGNLICHSVSARNNKLKSRAYNKLKFYTLENMNGVLINKIRSSVYRQEFIYFHASAENIEKITVSTTNKDRISNLHKKIFNMSVNLSL